MKALALPGWRPILTAFTIWFVHFMVCWAAAEIWPHQRTANAVAWAATAIALLAVGVHLVRVRTQRAAGELPGWHYRFARGAIMIAAMAVVFGVLPSLVFLP